MHTRKGGFTIVEILVAIAIIGILIAIGMGSITEGRKKARDNDRVADLKQIELYVEVYRKKTGAYPDDGSFSNQEVIGEGGDFDLVVEPQLSVELPMDPLGPSGSDYEYIYDTSPHSSCEASVIIYAKTMEREDKKNNGKVKCNDSGSYGNAHIVILGEI